jgi:hypothetical protein
VVVAAVAGGRSVAAVVAPVPSAWKTAIGLGSAVSVATMIALAATEGSSAAVRPRGCEEDSGAKRFAVVGEAAAFRSGTTLVIGPAEADKVSDEASDEARDGAWIDASDAAAEVSLKTVLAAAATPSAGFASGPCTFAFDSGEPGWVSAGATVGFVAGLRAPSACAALPSNWAKAAWGVANLPGLAWAFAWDSMACA